LQFITLAALIYAQKNLHGRVKISRLSSNSVHGWTYSLLPIALPLITVRSGRSLPERANLSGSMT
jgi:hypothetical protein